MKKINWGIMGTGQMADAFVTDFKYVENGRITSVFGRNENTRTEFQNKHAIPSAFGNLDDFLTSERVDIVYIATTNDSHFPLALAALEHGKHVLLEKPFTLNTIQTNTLLSRAKEKNLFIMEAIWTLFLPTIRQVLRWIDSGVIGQLKRVSADFSFFASEDINSRLFNLQKGGGSLLDVGIYPLMLFQKLADCEIKEVKTLGVLSESGVDVSTSFLIQYENGIQGTGTSGFDLQLENEAVIYGELGYIKIPVFWMAKKAYLYKDGTIEIYTGDHVSTGYNFEATAVNDDLLMGRRENKTVSHDFTQNLTKLLDLLRAQLGVYFKEDEGR